MTIKNYDDLTSLQLDTLRELGSIGSAPPMIWRALFAAAITME